MNISDLGIRTSQELLAHSSAKTPTANKTSFGDVLASPTEFGSATPRVEDTVTLNLHNITGSQFLAVEQTLSSEGKGSQTVLSPANDFRTQVDQIAMYGSWASDAATHHDATGAASFLDVQKALIGQGDGSGNITVDAATYEAALKQITG